MISLSFRTDLPLPELKEAIEVAKRHIALAKVRGWIRDRRSYREGCFQFIVACVQPFKEALASAAWSVALMTIRCFSPS